jgi:hypothetical protein
MEKKVKHLENENEKLKAFLTYKSKMIQEWRHQGAKWR